MPRQGKEHAVGPYKHGNKYRVVFIGANGARETESFETEAEAIAERDAHNAAAGCRTVGEAVKEYIASLPEKSQETAGFRLRGFFRLEEGDRPLSAITEAVARKLYEQRTKEVAVATHHGELGYAKRFGGFVVGKGWVRVNPVNATPTGEPNRGKPQLRVKETKTYLAKLLADTSPEATAVLTALTFSLRATAVISRTVEDVDDDGWILWVRTMKKRDRNGDKELEVPAFLRERYVRLIAGRGPKDLLFVKSDGKPATRDWLHYHTVRLCEEAGVSRVTPHGLRGSGASSKVRRGGWVEDAARDLDHEDATRGAITLKNHYLSGGAIESGRARAIEGLVTERDRSVSNEENPEVN